MPAPLSASSRTSTRSILHATRRWLAVPLVLLVLGAGAGAGVGVLAQPSAEALLLIQTDSTDGAGMERAAENAAVELNTSGLFDAVAASTGQDAGDLRARTKITVKPNSQIISIIVTAPTPEDAVAQATAVAGAGVAAGPNRVPDALDQITDATRDLINSHRLSSAGAEQARVARLGDALAGSQSALIDQANRVQLLQQGEPARLIPATPVLAAMGAAAGALLGLLAALVLGVHRGTVKSARELAQLYPQAEIIQPSDLSSMIFNEEATSTVLMAGVQRSGTDLAKLSDTVSRSLTAATGREVVVTESVSSIPTNAAPAGHINLVLTTLSETVMRRAARDQNALLIVPIEPRVTRLEALDAYASRLTDRSYLLIDDRSPKWD